MRGFCFLHEGPRQSAGHSAYHLICGFSAPQIHCVIPLSVSRRVLEDVGARVRMSGFIHTSRRLNLPRSLDCRVHRLCAIFESRMRSRTKIITPRTIGHGSDRVPAERGYADGPAFAQLSLRECQEVRGFPPQRAYLRYLKEADAIVR